MRHVKLEKQHFTFATKLSVFAQPLYQHFNWQYRHTFYSITIGVCNYTLFSLGQHSSYPVFLSYLYRKLKKYANNIHRRFFILENRLLIMLLSYTVMFKAVRQVVFVNCFAIKNEQPLDYLKTILSMLTS